MPHSRAVSGSTLERYLASVPTDAEAAWKEVEPFRHMTAQERWEALRSLLLALDRLRGDTPVRRDPVDADFWRYWSLSHLERTT